MILLLEINFFVLITGDLNARAVKWCRNDMTTTEGTKIDSVTTSYGFSQNISNPSNILPNSYSCIDLIFINQPNLVIESGVHPSLHLNSHNQIVFERLSLNVQYSLLYEYLTWDYKNVNEQLINHTIGIFNWPRWFEGKNVHDQVYLCNPLVAGVHLRVNKMIFNIFHNFILRKLSYANTKTYNVLMMKFGRSIISKMSSLNSLAVIGNYKATMIFIIFVYPLLSDPSTSAKTYRSILNILDNGKKVPLIFPLLFTGKFVTTF